MQENAQPLYGKARVGMMIFTVFFCAIITGFGNFKLLPMQTAIMEHFQIAESSYGYLNTSAGWISVFFAIPLGLLVRKLPCNVSVIIGFIVAVLGIFVQSVSATFVPFVIGRMIEGTGTGVVGLVTGSLTINLVPKKNISFWSCLMVMASVVPSVVMAKGGTELMLQSGLTFQTIFRIIGIIYIGFLVLWLIVMPFSLRISGVSAAVKPTRERTIRVLKNKSNWLVAIAHIFFNATSLAFTSYIIKFLMTKGIPQSQAASLYSYTTLLGLASMIVFGLIADKFKTKRKIAIMSYIAGAVAFVALAIVPANMILIYVILWGTLPRSIAGLTNAASADIAETPTDIPFVNSIKGTISSIGNIVVGILLGYMIQYCGYQFAVFFLAGGLVVGAICWYLAKKIP